MLHEIKLEKICAGVKEITIKVLLKLFENRFLYLIKIEPTNPDFGDVIYLYNNVTTLKEK
jgi:hypothetical protein